MQLADEVSLIQPDRIKKPPGNGAFKVERSIPGRFFYKFSADISAFCKSENFRQQKDSRNTFRFSAVKKLPRLQDSGFGSIASRIISLFF